MARDEHRDGVEGSWAVIHRWLRRADPGAEARLRRGLTGPGIERAERAMRSMLPPDYRASLAIHDGEELATGLMDGWMLSPLAEVVQAWTTLKALWDEGTFAHAEEPASCDDRGVRGWWWSPRWIPITADGAGNHQVLDLDPAPGGVAGQIVTFLHDSARREVVAPSFERYLASFAAQLERGACEVTYSPTGCLYGVRRRA